MSRLANIFLNHRYPFLLLVLTLAMLGMIEARHPYFFLQDDNRVLFLPLFVNNFRALAGGEFPLYNFHQYLGIPTGIQAHALYLPNYLATGLSSLLLGHYFGTMEILAMFHLVAATLGFYFLMRHFGLDGLPCTLGALAWTFSSFVITVSNSWIHVSACAAYLPWILLYSLRLRAGFAAADFLVLALLKVALLLAAHPQYALYVMTFEFMVVMLMHVADLREAKAGYAAGPGGFACLMARNMLNTALAAAVSLPLLLQGAREASVSSVRGRLLSWEDYSAGSYDLSLWLSGLFSPLKKVRLSTWNDLHFLSHIGYLPLIFIVLAVVWGRKDGIGRQVAVFFVLALFSLLWAGNTPVMELIYHLPLYNRFTTPFKLVFFTSFFLIVISTFGADLLHARMTRWPGSGQAVAAIFTLLLMLHAGNMLMLHTSEPQHAFIRFEDRIPLEEPLAGMLAKGNGRIVSAGLDLPRDGEKVMPGFSAALLGYNYASLWGLYHFGGYSALVPQKNHQATLGLINSSVYSLPADMPFDIPVETLEHYRKWGVRWYAIDARIPLPVVEGFSLVHGDSLRNVFRDASARPMVYWADRGDDSRIVAEFRANSVAVEADRNAAAELVLNVLHNPKFSATLDGVNAAFSETADGQVAVAVPAGRHQVRLVYSDRPLLACVAVSACFSLLAVAFIVFRKYGKTAR